MPELKSCKRFDFKAELFRDEDIAYRDAQREAARQLRLEKARQECSIREEGQARDRGATDFGSAAKKRTNRKEKPDEIIEYASSEDDFAQEVCC